MVNHHSLVNPKNLCVNQRPFSVDCQGPKHRRLLLPGWGLERSSSLELIGWYFNSRQGEPEKRPVFQQSWTMTRWLGESHTYIYIYLYTYMYTYNLQQILVFFVLVMFQNTSWLGDWLNPVGFSPRIDPTVPPWWKLGSSLTHGTLAHSERLNGASVAASCRADWSTTCVEQVCCGHISCQVSLSHESFNSYVFFGMNGAICDFECVHSSNEFGHISSTSYGRKMGCWSTFKVCSIQYFTDHFNSIPSNQSSQNRKPRKPLFVFEIPWENPRRIPASQPPMIFPTVHLLGRCEFWRHRRWGRVSRVASGKQPRLFFNTPRRKKQSPLLIGNSSINCGFSIAMLVDMMFTWCLYDNYDSDFFLLLFIAMFEYRRV